MENNTPDTMDTPKQQNIKNKERNRKCSKQYYQDSKEKIQKLGRD